MALGPVSASLEQATRAGELNAIFKYVALAGSVGGAIRIAEADRASPRVVNVLKTAVTAGGLSTWGSQVGDFGSLITAFFETLKNVSAFDALLPSMRRVPFRSRVVVVTAGATGVVVTEGHVTQISSLAFNGATTEQRKALAVIVANEELLKLGAPGTLDLFGRELRAAVATVTDQAFISVLTSGVSPITSAGTTVPAIANDFAAGFTAIPTSAASRLFAITTSAIAKAWTTRLDSGTAAFPLMKPQGGTMFGIPVIVSDGVTAGEIIFVDANSIAASAGTMEIDSSRHTILQMDTSPELASRCVNGPSVPLAKRSSRSARASVLRRRATAQRCRCGHQRRNLQRQLSGLSMSDRPKLTDAQLRRPLTAESIPAIMRAVADAIRPLQARIAELEAQASEFKYCGVWKSGVVYRKGNFVTHDGSLWHSNVASAHKPGDSSGAWTLAVKRGGNSK